MPNHIVIIPAFNEEKNIVNVLTAIDELKLDLDILVVDDGSVDRTARVVRERGVKVLSHPYNLGYGGALQTGFKYAVVKGYHYLIQFDADGQHDPQDIKKLLEYIQTGDMDIVIGSRFLGNSSHNTGTIKMVAINVFRIIIKLFTGASITDPSSGLQALSRRAFRYYARMGHFPADYPDADVIIQMLRAGYKICEIPANMRKRDNGESMHSGLKPIYYFIKMLVSITVVLIRGSKQVKGGRLHE